MLCPDVNALLYAFRRNSARHADYAAWLPETMTGEEPVGVSESTLSGLVRLTSYHRVYRHPSATAAALAFCEAVRTAPAALPLRPGAKHWQIFNRLCRDTGATANTAPDAYHAALAIENGATLVTNDRGFARFPHLLWRSPFE